MCPQGVYPAGDVCTIGDEISSGHEGRHISLYADNLTHSDALAVVTKGYPVIWGDAAVGIAFATQVVTENPLIAVDTEGIWCQDVFAQDDNGVSNVIPGDALFIDETTLLISKIRNPATNRPFGYALGTITGGSTDSIAVKVHWDPPESTEFFGAKIFNGAVTFDSTITVAGVTTLNGITIITQPLFLGAGINVTGAVILNSGLSVAGQVDLQIVFIHSEMHMAGILHLPDNVDAAILPAADPGGVNRLWVNGGVVTRN